MEKAYLTGVGVYLPEKILSNKDLEKIVDTSDEWITTRTGMKERRIANEKETTSFMAAEAAKEAIAHAGWKPEEVDCIIVATMTGDYPCPATACLVQEILGAEGAAAFDIGAACTGMLYGFSVAKAFVETGMFQKVVICAAEKMSSIVDYSDRSTCVLFGDGAAAAAISPKKHEKGASFALGPISLGADGSQKELLIVPAGGTKKRVDEEVIKNREHFLKMEGRETFKHAVRRMGAAVQEVLEKGGLSEKEVSYLVPHQANMRIIEAMGKRLDLAPEQVHVTIEKYGNTSASSVGIALHDLLSKNEIESGTHLMLVAFGAGLTWGAGILTKE